MLTKSGTKMVKGAFEKRAAARFAPLRTVKAVVRKYGLDNVNHCVSLLKTLEKARKNRIVILKKELAELEKSP